MYLNHLTEINLTLIAKEVVNRHEQSSTNETEKNCEDL